MLRISAATLNIIAMRVELIFDASGNYVANHMCITGYDPQTNPCFWQEQAMHNEGVPCGNWELDKELYE